jgi:hypothetical protein
VNWQGDKKFEENQLLGLHESGFLPSNCCEFKIVELPADLIRLSGHFSFIASRIVITS